MTDVLDGCIRLADASLDRSPVELDVRSVPGVFGDWEEPHRASSFAQRILLPSKPRVGAREHDQLKSTARALVDFRLQQRKRRFVLSSCLRNVAERLVSDRGEKRPWVDGESAGNRLGLDGIEKRHRLARIVLQEDAN